jgi:uncharacterized protein (DUF2267 family)
MSKLGILLDDEALADKLTKAGFDTPRKIRDAANSQLKKHITKSELDRVRERFPKQR